MLGRQFTLKRHVHYNWLWMLDCVIWALKHVLYQGWSSTPGPRDHLNFSCKTFKKIELNNIGYVDFSWTAALSCKNVNRFVSVNCSVQQREVMGTWYLFFHASNRHEQVLWKTYMSFETCLVFMLYVDYGFNNNNIHLHSESIFVHAHVD